MLLADRTRLHDFGCPLIDGCTGLSKVAVRGVDSRWTSHKNPAFILLYFLETFIATCALARVILSSPSKDKMAFLDMLRQLQGIAVSKAGVEA